MGRGTGYRGDVAGYAFPRAYRSGRKMMHSALRFLARYASPTVAVAAAVSVTHLLGPSRDIPFIVAVLLSAGDPLSAAPSAARAALVR
jgi:hypothetical protein